MRNVDPIKLSIWAHDLTNFELLISPNECTQCLKNLVRAYTGLEIEHKFLIFEGRYIAGGSLKDYNIKNESKIYLPGDLTLRENTILINVMTMDAMTFPVLVNPSITIDCLKKLMDVYIKQEHGRIPIDEQELHFNGNVLKSGTLQDFGVVNECTLVLRHRSSSNHTPVKLIVRKPNGTTFPVLIRLSETVDFLKRQISCVARILHHKQNLFFDDMRLTSGYLASFGLVDQAEVEIRFTNYANGQIFVEALNGAEMVFNVSSDCTIMEVKIMIQQRRGIPLDEQNLSFWGIQLKDGFTLSDYSIGRGSTLNLMQFPDR